LALDEETRREADYKEHNRESNGIFASLADPRE
jgi:hypothetical protein